MTQTAAVESLRKQRWRWLHKAAIALCIAATAVGTLGIVIWPEMRTYLQSAAILMQWNGQRLPVILKPIAGRPFTIREVTIPTSQGPIPARLYTPVDAPNAPGLVLVHGLNPDGMRGSRMEQSAEWNAACGLRVLTPDVQELREYHLGPASIDTIGESARWFAQQTRQPVTLMGVSYAGGLSLMAAAKPEFASSVKIVFLVGGYDDLNRVERFYVTGMEPRPDGSIEERTPSQFGALLMEYTHLEFFAPAADRDVLQPMLAARIFDRNTLLPAMQARLTDAQRAEWQSLLDAHANEAGLEKVMRLQWDDARTVSPHGHLAGLQARVFILHGQNDDFIPSAEAQWLAHDLPPGKLDEMLISPIVSHVILGGKADAWIDKWQLVRFMAQELRVAGAQ